MGIKSGSAHPVQLPASAQTLPNLDFDYSLATMMRAIGCAHSPGFVRTAHRRFIRTLISLNRVNNWRWPRSLVPIRGGPCTSLRLAWRGLPTKRCMSACWLRTARTWRSNGLAGNELDDEHTYSRRPLIFGRESASVARLERAIEVGLRSLNPLARQCVRADACSHLGRSSIANDVEATYPVAAPLKRCGVTGDARGSAC